MFSFVVFSLVLNLRCEGAGAVKVIVFLVGSLVCSSKPIASKNHAKAWFNLLRPPCKRLMQDFAGAIHRFSSSGDVGLFLCHRTCDLSIRET